MGYSASLEEARFHIRAEHFPAALEAVKALCHRAVVDFAWVSNSKVLRARDLDAAIEEWGWALVHSADDPTQDVIALAFEGEKLGDESQLWAALAPFVTPGSYIEMYGEDGDRWRWVFKGPTVKYITARYYFPEDESHD